MAACQARKPRGRGQGSPSRGYLLSLGAEPEFPAGESNPGEGTSPGKVLLERQVLTHIL
jgi:hypothetical protein